MMTGSAEMAKLNPPSSGRASGPKMNSVPLPVSVFWKAGIRWSV